MSKINVKLLNKIIIINLFIIIIFTSCNFEESTEQHIDKYLSRNYSKLVLDGNDDFSSFKLLDKDLKKNEMFLTGEIHGTTMNTELELSFLKYLKEKANIKYYLSELSYSDAYFLNKYLDTGDENILKELFEELKDTPGCTKETYNKWIKVYEFNKALPNDKKIKVIGIDIEHQENIAIHCMYSLIPKNESPKKIRPLIKKLQDVYENNGVTAKFAKDFSLDLKKDINENYDIYKEYLGEKFFDFNLINDNLCTSFKAYNDMTNFNKIRDMQMYENFINIYNNLPKGKFYGQFGNAHINQHNMYDDTYSLASLMNNKNSPVKGKVISIIYVYNSCKIFNPLNAQTIHTITTLKEDNIFKSYLETNTTLFKLNGWNSPFDKGLIWELLSPGGILTKGVTTDYYQYIVVVKNSQPMEPIK